MQPDATLPAKSPQPSAATRLPVTAENGFSRNFASSFDRHAKIGVNTMKLSDLHEIGFVRQKGFAPHHPTAQAQDSRQSLVAPIPSHARPAQSPRVAHPRHHPNPSAAACQRLWFQWERLRLSNFHMRPNRASDAQIGPIPPNRAQTGANPQPPATTPAGSRAPPPCILPKYSSPSYTAPHTKGWVT